MSPADPPGRAVPPPFRSARGPRHRPPWWPTDEPWPPGREHYRRRGHASFLWRVGCLLVVLAFMFLVVAGLGVWVAAFALGAVSAPLGAFAGALVTFVISAVVVGFLARSVRQMAAQLEGLVGASGRIEAGDYGVRLAEPRQPELRSVARAFNSMAARLQATDERRRTFLAEMAHELRTPISVIRGQLEAMQDGVYPADEEHIEPALAQARTLEHLVEDVRTLGLAETGNLPLSYESVDPALLVNETLTGFRDAARAAGITLTALLPPELPTVRIDPARIRGVLVNLLGNAVEHTPAGGSVTVETSVSGQSLTVEVRDTGTGIPPELLPRVFDRFVKGAGSRGSGLGLAIARDIVAAHGGTIAVQGQLGGGTAVSFTLPLVR